MVKFTFHRARLEVRSDRIIDVYRYAIISMLIMQGISLLHFALNIPTHSPNPWVLLFVDIPIISFLMIRVIYNLAIPSIKYHLRLMRIPEYGNLRPSKTYLWSFSLALLFFLYQAINYRLQHHDLALALSFVIIGVLPVAFAFITAQVLYLSFRNGERRA